MKTSKSSPGVTFWVAGVSPTLTPADARAASPASAQSPITSAGIRKGRALLMATSMGIQGRRTIVRVWLGPPRIASRA